MTLNLSQLGHAFTADHWLFRDVSWSLPPAAVTALVGPNGSGKSTLLAALAGLLQPTEGCVLLRSKALRTFTPDVRAKTIGYLPQQTPLYAHLTVRDLVALGRAPHQGRWSPTTQRDLTAIDAAIERVALQDLADRDVLSLSGGERQRALLARLLATETPTLLLDEPTTGLDISHTLAFLQLCQTLAEEGRTLLLAMHDLNLARRFARHAMCLTASSKVHVGNAVDVLSANTISEVFNVQVKQPGIPSEFYFDTKHISRTE